MNLKITLRHMALLFAVIGTTLLSAAQANANVVEAFTGTVKYRYNALGQRTSKTVNGTTTYYLYDLDGNRIAELDNNGNVTREYIYLNGEPLAQVDNVNTENEQIYYSHNDHLGAPLMLTDQNQNIVWQAVRTPFGEIVEETTGATTQSRSFPGQYHDEETATDYNYHRDYDPALGRYIQSDPIGLAGGVNTYAYVRGNPLMFIDPLGLKGLYCSRPLGDFSGVNGSGLHIFSCITLADGTWRCDSQNNPDDDNNPFWPSQGEPSKPERDNPGTGECKEIDDDKDRCFEDCMIKKYDEPRPLYTAAGVGQNCREWSSDKVLGCVAECSGKQ